MKRHLAGIFLAGILLLFAHAGWAAPSGLVLGFSGGTDIALQTVSTADRVVTTVTPEPGSWSIDATASDGRSLWSRPVRIPRSLHGGRDQRFFVVVPQVEAGTRLSLRDSSGVVLWSQVADNTLLAAARAQRGKADAALEQARGATAALQTAKTSPALLRQVDASQMLAGSPSAMAKMISAPSAAPAAPSRASEGSDHLADPSQRISRLPDWVERAIASADPADAPGLASNAGVNHPTASATTVDVILVDNQGQAPGEPVNAVLFRTDGTEVTRNLVIPADGRFQLSVVPGADYDIMFLPSAPLIDSAMTRFRYNGVPLPNFVIERGWLLDIRFTDAEDGAPLAALPSGQVFSYYDPLQRVLRGTASPGRLRFGIPRNTGLQQTLAVSAGTVHSGSVRVELGILAGNVERTLPLERTAPVTASIVVDDGQPLPGFTQAHCYRSTQGIDFTYVATVQSNGTATLRLPPAGTYECIVWPSAPLVYRSFSNVRFGGAPVVLRLFATARTSFALLESDGSLHGDTPVVQLTAPGVSEWRGCPANPCVLQLPSQIAVTLSFQFSDPDVSDIVVGPERFAVDSERTLTVQRHYRVGGSLDFEGHGGRPVRIRAFAADTGAFVTSTMSRWWNSTYELKLPAGQYILEADRNPASLDNDELHFRQPKRSAPFTLSGSIQLPPLTLNHARSEFVLFAHVPCQLPGNYQANLGAIVTIVAADGTRMERMAYHDSSIAGPPAPDGMCSISYLVRLSPGSYALEIALPGWSKRHLAGIELAEGTRTTHIERFNADERNSIWRGRLTVAGMPWSMGFGYSDVFGATADSQYSFWIGSDGSFDIPYNVGSSVEFKVFSSDFLDGSRHRQLLDGLPIPTEVDLSVPTFDDTLEQGLIRLYGNGDREKRFNILFLGDGYVADPETYVDTNGNGVWDGVIWHDLNGDGVFNGASDLVGMYGNAGYPMEGSVPTISNEPFVDGNADGVPSIDDPGLFLLNAHSFMRSLLGSDFWSEHRDGFNAYALFEGSPQAGFSVKSASGEALLERSTLYAATLDQARYTLEVDRTRAMTQALAALPEVDVVVMLINQPIAAGRANIQLSQPGIMVYGGGPQRTSPHDLTPSHEMGHFVGSLCDEYEEFDGNHPSQGRVDSWCPNASYVADPTKVPWAAWLDPELAVPTRGIEGGIGVFEGADYYGGGAYRPSFSSTMRDLSPFFNAPSRAALAEAMYLRGRGDSIHANGFDDAIEPGE